MITLMEEAEVVVEAFLVFAVVALVAVGGLHSL